MGVTSTATSFMKELAVVLLLSLCFYKYTAADDSRPDVPEFYSRRFFKLDKPCPNVIQLSINYLPSRISTWQNTSIIFLIPLDWKESNVSSTINTLTKVAIHNKQNVKKMELWLALYPKEDASIELNIAKQIATAVNQVSNGTISAFLLDYGLLSLNSITLPLVRQDMQTCSAKMVSENLKCGLIIDHMNSLSSIDHILQLGLSSGTILIISRDSLLYDDNAIRFHMETECKEKLSKAKILFGTTTDVNLGEYDIEDEKKFISHIHYKEEKKRLLNNTAWTFNIQTLDYYVTNLKPDSFFTLSNMRKFNPIDNEKEWMDRPMKFDESSFGMSIYAKDTFLAQSEAMLTSLVNQFRTIFIETTTHGCKVPWFPDILGNISTTAGLLPVDTDISLVMPIYTKDLKSNKLMLNCIHSAIAAQDKNSQVTVFTILFNWALPIHIYKYYNATIINNLSVFDMYLIQASILQPVLDYTATLKHTNIQYGVIWDVDYIDSLIFKNESLEDRTKLLGYLGMQTKHIQTVILKKTISLPNLYSQGLLIITRRIMFQILSYKNLLKGNFAERSKPLSVKAYIGVVGCNGAAYNITDITNFVLFWDIFSTWAVKNDVELIMNTAYQVEDNINDEYDNCRNAIGFHFVFGWTSCMCGWWHVSNKTGNSSDAALKSMIKLEDKKSIARRLYLEANPPDKPQIIEDNVCEKSKNSHVAWIIFGTIFFSVLLVAVTSYLVYHYRSKNIISKREFQQFLLGNQNPSNTIETEDEGICIAQTRSYDSARYEIKPSAFSIDLSRPLGEGEFASVYRGTIRKAKEEIEVAVKVKSEKLSTGAQRHGNLVAIRGLIAEIKMLSYVEDHANIVKLEGAYTANLRKGTALVFLELCANGSLDKYLRSFNPEPNQAEIVSARDVEETSFTLIVANNGGKDSSEKDIERPLPTQFGRDLVKWSREIANGMEFLARLKIVHADLATRNILLDATKTAKICDFGLSRRLYDYSDYVKQESTTLPWRWMAPESLRRFVYNEKSDVWAFGITLWEMYTLGDLPYPGLSYHIDFPTMLCNGVRLQKPKYSSNMVYEIMSRCWQTCPGDRPSFAELHTMLMSLG